MFVLCPHCQFLVAMDPRTGAPPAACPNCGGAMGDGVEEAPCTAADDAVATPPLRQRRVAQRRTHRGGPSPADPRMDAAPTPSACDADSETFSADAMIAAMSAKPDRRPRAKPRSPNRSLRRLDAQRASRRPTHRAGRAVARPPPPCASRRSPRARRMSDAHGALGGLRSKPTAKPKRRTDPSPRRSPHRRPRARKRSVKPIPSLRARAKAKPTRSLQRLRRRTSDPSPVVPTRRSSKRPWSQRARRRLARAIEVAPVETRADRTRSDRADAGRSRTRGRSAVADVIADVATTSRTRDADRTRPTNPCASHRHDDRHRSSRTIELHRHPRYRPSPASATRALHRHRRPRVRRAAPPASLRTQHALRTARCPRAGRARDLAALALLLVAATAARATRRARARRALAPAVVGAVPRVALHVAAWRDPAAFTMLARDVRPHPSARRARCRSPRVSATTRAGRRRGRAWC